jgi:peptidyl-prolyl cis-trans isomerase D
MEQKLFNQTNIDGTKQIIGLKNSMFNEGLIKNLQNKYKTEMFTQGL